MKKFFAMALVLVLALSMVACGGTASSTSASASGTEFKDGTYHAVSDEPSYGWLDFLTVTYENGVVIAASYDAYGTTEDGSIDETKLKSAATAEEYPMDPLPSVWMPQLSENVVAAGNAEDIEAVAGATMGSSNVKQLMAAIEEAARKGDTETQVVTFKTEEADASSSVAEETSSVAEESSSMAADSTSSKAA